MSNTNIGHGAGSTVTLYVVKAYSDAPIELYRNPANAIVRLEQLMKEWGDSSPSMEEIEVIDTRPEWGPRR